MIVSYYFELTKRQKVFSASMSEFIRDPRYGLERLLWFNTCWFRQNVCEDLLIITYEQLHRVPHAALSRSASFLGHPRSERRVRRAVARCAFDVMQKKEKSGALSRKFGKAMLPADPGDPESYKTRRGKVGGFTDYLSIDDCEWCARIIEDGGCQALLGKALSRYGLSDANW